MHLPCLLCSKDLEERTSKKDKPYFVCDSCGMQLFIRRKQGIEKLRELCRALRLNKRLGAIQGRKLFVVREILNELNGIEEEVKKLDNDFDLFKDRKTKDRARAILKQRIEDLLAELQALTITSEAEVRAAAR